MDENSSEYGDISHEISHENGEKSYQNSEISRQIVIDCPVCKRTIWANSRCLHGEIPPKVKVFDQEYVKENESSVTKTRKRRGKYDCD